MSLLWVTSVQNPPSEIAANAKVIYKEHYAAVRAKAERERRPLLTILAMGGNLYVDSLENRSLTMHFHEATSLSKPRQ